MINTEQIQEIQQATDLLKEKLSPHMTQLSVKSRRHIYSLGDASTPFVTKSVDYALNNPHLVPPFINADELAARMKQLEELQLVQRQLAPLLKNLDDTILQEGGEIYQTALAFYKSLQSAVQGNAANAETIRADLARRFKTGPRKNGSDAA